MPGAYGKVVERKEGDVTLAGQQFRASSDDPKFIVESARSGKRAAHAAVSLTHL